MTEEILSALDKSDAALRHAQERIAALEAEASGWQQSLSMMERAADACLVSRDAALARANKAEERIAALEVDVRNWRIAADVWEGRASRLIGHHHAALARAEKAEAEVERLKNPAGANKPDAEVVP